MEDDLKKNEKMEDNLKIKIKIKYDLNKMKWKTTSKSTKINLIGSDTIVNSPSYLLLFIYYYL